MQLLMWLKAPCLFVSNFPGAALFINEAQTGVMAWWSMGRWTDRAARKAIIAQAMTMTLADFRRWFARHEASYLVD